MSYNNIMANSLGSSKTSLVFKVTRQAPELIPPAGPTPYEFKELSDIDDQDALRLHVPVIQFYRHEEKHSRGRDPARVIKEAVAKALVSYYPFAGRLREKQGRKLVVECTREGIMFIEADADVTLEEFGDELHPPLPCFKELLYDVPGSTDILDTPLILIQVTRLKCGGFILALRLNHTMADGPGLVQFMNAVAELARGADSPSIYPVWERHLLSARDPPRVTCQHHAYDEVAETKETVFPLHDMAQKSFFFGPTEIAALRRFIPLSIKASTFEILTACLWRCRTIALQPDPKEIFRISCLVNARSSQFHAYVPKGYYGNSFAVSASISTAKEISSNPISYALELVKKAKNDVTQEHMQSLADLMVLKGRPCITTARTFVVSNITRAGFDNLNFGWGPPAYGGSATGGLDEALPGVVTFYNSYKNGKGEQGIVVAICLPTNAMVLFIKELNGLLSDVPTHPIAISSSL